jgi:hypothetical protein
MKSFDSVHDYLRCNVMFITNLCDVWFHDYMMDRTLVVIIINNISSLDWSPKTSCKRSTTTHYKQPILVCFMNYWNKTNKQPSFMYIDILKIHLNFYLLMIVWKFRFFKNQYEMYLHQINKINNRQSKFQWMLIGFWCFNFQNHPQY